MRRTLSFARGALPGLSGIAPALRSWLTYVRRLAVRLLRGFGKLSLFQQFALLTLVILVVGAYVIGSYVSGEIRDKVTQRTSALTALYVDSFVSPHLQELATNHNVSEEHFAHLDLLLKNTSLGQKIVAFKIWHLDGEVVYANERKLIGTSFPITGGLAEALAGDIHTETSTLDDAENVFERGQWGRLMETYAPIRDETGRVIGVSEFYHDPAELEAEVNGSQIKGWFMVGGATGVMYLALVGLVGGASRTIVGQHSRLEQLAWRNADLAKRVRRAAVRKSETDEQLLKRLAQDLHDGPAQDISLALLRIDALTGEQARASRQDADLTRTALTSALKEIREICAGLRLPEMAGLTLGDVIKKVANAHRDKTGNVVRVALCAGMPDVDVPTKIVLYRIIQEALNNAYRHGAATRELVRVSVDQGKLQVEVSDDGAGIGNVPDAGIDGRTHFGIRGMRERVEMLGGTLEIGAHTPRGTIVRAVLPLAVGESSDA